MNNIKYLKQPQKEDKIFLATINILLFLSILINVIPIALAIEIQGTQPVWVGPEEIILPEKEEDFEGIFLADLDNDTDLDLILAVGRIYVNYSITDKNGLIFYRNKGDNQNPEWTRDDIVFGEIADIGTFPFPVLGDIDLDGDLDLFIGQYNQPLTYYENKGTNEHPRWYPDSDTFSELTCIRTIQDPYSYDLITIRTECSINTYFTLADINQDGQLELITWNEDKKLIYYHNIGTPEFQVWEQGDDIFEDIQQEVGEHPTPLALADLDKDGDPDLILKGQYAEYICYKNDGTVQSPIWVKNNEMVKNLYSLSAPTFGDLDNDGDLDAMLRGSLGHNINYFENQEDDDKGPTNGIVIINEGNGTTSSPSVVLTISATDARYMRISNYRDFSIGMWEDYAQRKNWQLAPRAIKGSRQKVYIQFMDNEGNLSPMAYDEIISEYGRDGIPGDSGFCSAQWSSVNSIKITWEKVALAQGYIVERSVDFFDFKEITNIFQGDTTYFTDTDIKPDYSSYLYRIIACNSEGCSEGTLSNRVYISGGVDPSPNDLPLPSFVNPRTILPYTYDDKLDGYSFGDIDNDGDLDIVVSYRSGGSSNHHKLHFYKNTSTGQNPLWTFDNSLSIDIGDAGYNPFPVLGDVDEDGDLDLLIGAFGTAPAYYKNSGTKEQPQWDFDTETFAQLSFAENTFCALVDVNQDGFLELVAWADDGELTCFKNNGTFESPLWEEGPDIFRNINYRGNLPYLVGSYLSPFTMIDLDKNGYLDLVIGREEYFEYAYFKNDFPFWIKGPSLSGSIPYNISVIPVFGDVDGDGDMDLMIRSSGRRNISYYQNQGDDNNGPTEGSLIINGDAVSTDSPQTVLTLNAKDAVYMKISNYREGHRGLWDIYAQQKTWRLPEGNTWGSVQNVYVYYMDQAGFLSHIAMDSIICNYGRPPSVENLQGDHVVSQGIYIQWNDIEHESGYRIFRLKEGEAFLEITSPIQNSTFYIDTSVEDDLRYQYKIIAYNNWGDSDPTYSECIYTPPHAPTGIQASRGSSMAVVVTWVDNSCYEDSFSIERSEDQGIFTAMGSAYNTVYMDYDVAVGKAYRYRVRACIGQNLYSGYSEISNAVLIDKLLPCWGSSQSMGLYIGDHCAPSLADLDNDGDFDLIVNSQYGDLLYYKNIGNSKLFSWQRDDTIFQIINSEFGVFPVPTFGDLDNDGDLDLVLGRFSGDILFYRNTGSASAPQWKKEESMFAQINTIIDFPPSPFLVDLDNDGDLDLVLGGNNYFENTGTRQVPQWQENNAIFQSIQGDLGENATVTFSDLDNDEDYDLILGTSSGLKYFQNKGDSAQPLWEAGIDMFTSIQVQEKAHPTFADIDDDGDKDLIAGDINGYLIYYENTAIRDAIVGDVNNDSKVNIYDLILVAKLVGKEKGDPGYNPVFDLNNDDSINIYDMIMVAKNII